MALPRAGWAQLIRSLLVVALGCVLVRALAWASADPVRHVLAGDIEAVLRDYPAALSAAAATLAWLVVLWYAGCLALALVARLPGATGRLGARAAARITPAAVRRLAEATVGAGVVLGGTAQVAYAAPAHAPQLLERDHAADPAADRADPRVDLAALADLPVPDRSPVPPHPADHHHRSGRHGTGDHGTGDHRSRRQHRRTPPDLVLVRPGDTLWAIAARHLPGAPSARRIATAWPRWYAANRHVIGPDPDLIRPGQRLRPPAH